MIKRPASTVTAADTFTYHVGNNISLAAQMVDANGNPVNSVVGLDEDWQFEDPSVAEAYGSGFVNSNISVVGAAGEWERRL